MIRKLFCYDLNKGYVEVVSVDGKDAISRESKEAGSKWRDVTDDPYHELKFKEHKEKAQ